MKSEEKLNNLKIDEISDLIESGIIRDLAIEAANAVHHLWSQKLKTFWRSTDHRTRDEAIESDSKFFPTVTFRCLEALLWFQTEFPDWAGREIKEQVLECCVPALVTRNIEDIKSSLVSVTGTYVLHPFTLSLFIQTLARICEFRELSHKWANMASQTLQTVGQKLIQHPNLQENSSKVEYEMHPFVQYHILRAIELSYSYITSNELKSIFRTLRDQIVNSIPESADKLLARHRLGLLSPSDAIALSFYAASLTMSRQSEDSQYIQPALEIAFEAQDPSGCWPLGRVVQEAKDIQASRMEISTYEIAWALAETIRIYTRKMRASLIKGPFHNFVLGLIKSAQYARGSIIQLSDVKEPLRGWCTDHPYGKQMIESWTSATVLQAALSLHNLVEEVNRQLILNTFTCANPHDQDWPSWLLWEDYRISSEPDTDHPVLTYLHQKIVLPILDDPRGLPNPKNRNVSILLFGPPGTQKTTIVKALAEGLAWPVVLLSPGNFIEKGLEYIEAQARSVFERLLKLVRAVILFDECDELFRDREPRPELEQVRGIMAFVTASMLPKLQELHDRGRVVIFICTNNFESLDPAIKRGGRVDHIIGVGPPDSEARRRIIKETLGDLTEIPFFNGAIEQLVISTDRFTRAELQRAAYNLKSLSDWSSESAARKAARMVADQMKGSLIIKANELEKFNQLKEQYSHHFSEGGQKNE